MAQRPSDICLASKILDFYWIYGVGQFKAKDFGVEVQLRFQYSLDILGLSETVLLALECEISDR